jgi:hypothetical protein
MALLPKAKSSDRCAQPELNIVHFAMTFRGVRDGHHISLCAYVSDANVLPIQNDSPLLLPRQQAVIAPCCNAMIVGSAA